MNWISLSLFIVVTYSCCKLPVSYIVKVLSRVYTHTNTHTYIYTSLGKHKLITMIIIDFAVAQLLNLPHATAACLPQGICNAGFSSDNYTYSHSHTHTHTYTRTNIHNQVDNYSFSRTQPCRHEMCGKCCGKLPSSFPTTMTMMRTTFRTVRARYDGKEQKGWRSLLLESVVIWLNLRWLSVFSSWQIIHVSNWELT